MDTNPRFCVRTHPKVRQEDLPELPQDLREDYDSIFVPLLGLDPYECWYQSDGYSIKFPSHDLDRGLTNYRAIEIDEYDAAYRLVYRIFDSPETMRVDVFSFAAHKPAYDRAKARIPREAVRKW